MSVFLIIIYSTGVLGVESVENTIFHVSQKNCVCVRDKKYKIFLIIVVCPFGTYWVLSEDWLGRGDIQQSKGKSIDFLTLYSTFFGAHHTDYSNIIACLLEYDTLIYIKYNIIQQTTSHHIIYIYVPKVHVGFSQFLMVYNL